MKKLFDADGKLMSLIGKVGDHFLLSLLWLVCSLPVITAGAAGAAMCQVSFQILEGQECRLVPDYFAAMKRHFKTATKLWLAVLAVGLVFVLDVYFYLYLAAQNGSFATVLLGMIGLIGLVGVLCLIWLYPYMVLYEAKFVQTVKMAFLLGVMNLGWTALMLVLDCAVMVLSLFATFLVPFVPGLIALVNSLCILKALRKYRKEAPQQPEV